MDRGLRVLQIHYDAASRAALDPDFEPLDNSASERPDWYEFWPMREFLRREPLDPAAYYGVVSPRFFAKTGLSGRQVREFARQAGEADVITYSPYPCHSACFISIFEQGDYFHPGLLEASARFLGEVAPEFSLELDRLKIAFCDTGEPQHLHAYAALRNQLLRAVYPAKSP